MEMSNGFKKMMGSFDDYSAFQRNTSRSWKPSDETNINISHKENEENCWKKEVVNLIMETEDNVDKKDIVHPAIQEQKTIRMQEVEEFMLSNLIIRNINGNLCIWTGKYYKPVNAMSFAQEIRKILPRDLQNKISKYSVFKESFEYMRANDKISEDFTESNKDRAKDMLAFKNGVYDARTGQLMHHDSRYPIMFLINANYDEEDRNTEIMDDVLEIASNGDKQVKKLFYESLGYILSQGCSLKRFFVFGTAPDSGKSIVGEFIARLLGDENTSTLSLHDLGRQFALGTISQKVLNYNMDLPAETIRGESVQKLKLLTGDARIESEMKYVQGSTVYHHCKFLFATNHPIRLKKDDEAFFNRMVVIPFLNSVNEEDKDYTLAKKLWKERDAIVSKAARAYRKLCKRNYVFTESVVAREMIDEWRDRPWDYKMKSFVQERCLFQKDDDSCFTPTEELFKAYQQFCDLDGCKVGDDEKIMFSTRFHEFTRLKSDRKRRPGYDSAVHGYIGVRLK